MKIGTASLALLFVSRMATYRDIDLALYTDLPKVLRSLVNVPKDADIGSLAYGANRTRPASAQRIPAAQ